MYIQNITYSVSLRCFLQLFFCFFYSMQLCKSWITNSNLCSLVFADCPQSPEDLPFPETKGQIRLNYRNYYDNILNRKGLSVMTRLIFMANLFSLA